MIERKQVYINGAWIDSTSHEVLTVVNAATGEPLATVPRGTAQDVDKAARAAAAAFPLWRTTSVEERVRLFERLAEITERRADEITRTIVSELGYPAKQAHKAQTLGAVDELRVIAECLREIRWVEQIGDTRVRREIGRASCRERV